MLRLYTSVLLALRPAAALWAAWRGRDPERRRECAERLARALPAAGPGALWIHGASVGEARIVAALAGALRQRHPRAPLVVSALTPTGRAQLPAPPAVDSAFFAPLDLPGLPERLLDALLPAELVLVETELWPILLDAARRRGVPAVIVNARLSQRRMARYRRLAALYRPLVAGLAAVGAQSAADAERFRELGARPGAVRVTGNVKYDLPAPALDAPAVRARLGLDAARPVLVAGSTGAGEEPAVLEAWRAARERVPGLLLAIAPRHPRRADEVAALVERRGHRLVRLAAGRPVGTADVLLVDTLGELASLYAVGSVAFVGGSLVPLGGHNVLEPAALGVPVIFGPHTTSVAEPAERLLEAGAARRVTNAAALCAAVVELCLDRGSREAAGERGRRVVEAERGALERSVALVLDARRGAAAAGAA